MKKLTLIVAALALVMGFSQCKKDNLTPNDNRIQITLNANYGGNGSKTTFDPANGTFEWLQGYGAEVVEYINVGGSQSGYLGQLNNNDNKGTGTFNGSITTPQDGETLYFFYLGNGDHAGATTLDFSNQSSGTVTNWHIAIGSATYDGTSSSFSATLNMAMAIAYFDLSGFNNDSKSAETVYLSGNDVYSTASINYKEGTITGNSKGQIKLGTANNGMYVALIPSVTTSTTLNFSSSSKKGSMTFNNGIKPAYFYSNSGGALLVEATTGSGIPGTFSVSATKKVFFSKGNLQYNPHGSSTDASGNVIGGTWRFAEHQYDAIGNNAGNNVFDGTRSEQNAWIDLFGWGTSGWNNNNTYYKPYDYQTFAHTSKGYGPMKNSWTYSFPLTGDYANADWGVYNTISNGGAGWRTLTGGTTADAEWYYLLFSRNASTVAGTDNARYFMATVNGIWGLVILPDVYSHPIDKNPSNINTSATSYTITAYTIDEWNAIESAGAVFLPRVGYRSYSSDNPSYTENQGYYWSTTNNSGDKAHALSISSSCSVSSIERRRGCFVRLVKDVE